MHHIINSCTNVVKYFFNLILSRKHNFKPDCSELQLSKMAAILLTENEARIIIKRAKW